MTDINRDMTAIVLREASRLASFIKSRVRSSADAEDIVQEVFFEFVQAYRLPESIEQVGAWLFRVARNRIVDRFRKKSPRPLSELMGSEEEDANAESLDLLLPSPDAGPDAEVDRSMLIGALQAALEELPMEQRDIFVANEIEGESFASVARREGIPLNTLLSRKRYAVQHLRRRLQSLYDELD